MKHHLIAFLVLVGAAEINQVHAADPPLRVAISDFTVDDNSYRSVVAARNFATVLQAELGEITGIEWVEREQLDRARRELNLAVAGLISAGSELRVGRWVKADLMVIGRFEIDEKKNRHLRLETVDLDYADLIAAESIPLKAAAGDSLPIDKNHVAQAKTVVARLLETARSRLKSDEGKIVVAPLFFGNAHISRRLSYLETEITETIVKAAEGTDKARVVRFPRAQESTQEAEMVVAGMVEGASNKWSRVADLYIWGSYAEQTAANASLADTPLRATICFWDGSSEIRCVDTNATVGAVEEIKKYFGDQVSVAVDAYQRTDPSDAGREKLVSWIAKRNAEFETALGGDFSSLAQDESERLRNYQLNLLATARFFQPERLEVNRKWLMRQRSPTSFWGYWNLLNQWTDHLERFDLIIPDKIYGEILHNFYPVEQSRMDMPPWPPKTVDAVASGRWFEMSETLIDGIEVLGLRSGKRLCRGCQIPIQHTVPFELLQKKLPFFPSDVPPSTLEEWRSQLLASYGRTLARIATEMQNTSQKEREIFTPDRALRVADIEDAALRAKVLEAIWPFVLRYFEAFQPQGTPEDIKRDYLPLLEALEKTFAAVGQPETGRTMSSAARKHLKILEPPAPAPAVAEAKKPNVHSAPQPQQPITLDLLPPKLQPKITWVPFPPEAAVDGIVTAGVGNDHLWLSTYQGALGEQFMPSRKQYGYRLLPTDRAALWRLELSNGSLACVTDKLRKHSKVTSLWADGDHLWLTLNGDGVWKLNTQTFAIDEFRERQGLLTSQLFASRAVNGSLFVGGGDTSRGWLNRLDREQGDWKRLDWNFTPPPAQVQHMGAYKKHLIVSTRETTGVQGELAHVLESNDLTHWRDIQTNLFAGSMGGRTYYNERGAPVVFDSAADNEGLWLATNAGLIRYNPETEKRDTWFSRMGGFFVDEGIPNWRQEFLEFSRLRGSATALATEGDFLWIATAEDEFRAGPQIVTSNQFGGTSSSGSMTPTDMKTRYQVMLLHKPTRKWAGCFTVPTRVTALLVANDRLWIGLMTRFTPDYVADGPNWKPLVLSTPLLSVPTRNLLATPTSAWVEDKISVEELEAAFQRAQTPK